MAYSETREKTRTMYKTNITLSEMEVALLQALFENHHRHESMDAKDYRLLRRFNNARARFLRQATRDIETSQ